MGIKQKYADYKFKQLLKEHSRNIKLPDLEKQNKVLVIWQPSQKQAYKYLKEYFRTNKDIFRGYCIF